MQNYASVEPGGEVPNVMRPCMECGGGRVPVQFGRLECGRCSAVRPFRVISNAIDPYPY